MIQQFISEYGTQIIMAVLTAIAGALGLVFKNLYKRAADDKIKQAVAKTCVQAVEQLYQTLNGKQRYEKCTAAISDMLAEKGITISELEIRMLVEAAVGEFNRVFEGADQPAQEEEPAEEDGLLNAYDYDPDEDYIGGVG